MGDVTNGWNISEGSWAAAVAYASEASDALEDGAYVRVGQTPDSASSTSAELHFYASAINRPPAWHYPFTETIDDIDRAVAYIGRSWHHPETGFVEFEVQLPAAAAALLADFEGGVADFDEVALEQEIAVVMRGTQADMEWVKQEFERLFRFVEQR